MDLSRNSGTAVAAVRPAAVAGRRWTAHGPSGSASGKDGRTVGWSDWRLAGQKESRTVGWSDWRPAGQKESRTVGWSDRRLAGQKDHRTPLVGSVRSASTSVGVNANCRWMRPAGSDGRSDGRTDGQICWQTGRRRDRSDRRTNRDGYRPTGERIRRNDRQTNIQTD